MGIEHTISFDHCTKSLFREITCFKICEFITPKDGQVLISEKVVITHFINCGHTANIFG